MTRQGGAALVVALMISALIGALLLIVQGQTRLVAERTGAMRDLVDARAAVRTARSRLAFGMLTTNWWIGGQGLPPSDRMPAAANPYGVAFDSWDARIAIQDAAGLLPLLPLEDGLWQHILNALDGVDDETRRRFIPSLLDWMDSDDFIHLNGAERRDYQEFKPRDGDPQHVSELRMVMGMSDNSWRALRPHLVLFSGGGANSAHAADVLLDAWLGSDQAARERDLRSGLVNPLGLTGVVDNIDSSDAIGNRLRVTISAERGLARHVETLTMIRSLGGNRPLVMTEIVAGGRGDD